MKKFFPLFATLFWAMLIASCCSSEPAVVDIPLPEHPRPDFERADFVNLNGYWNFTFNVDEALASVESASFDGFDQKILVPFPWGSKLSEVEDGGDVAWYGRSIQIPASWKGKRVFVVVGASDWETEGWFDGKKLGSHQGGYTPFEFELTDYIVYGKQQNIYFKVDDTSADWHLYGKQGYGNARGIWQTVYLEARGGEFIESVHFSPDIKAQKVKVEVSLPGPASEGTEVEISFKNAERGPVTAAFGGDSKATFDIELPNQHLWNLDDPYLYEVVATLKNSGTQIDAVSTYFGQREIGTADMPGGYKYVALNGKPIYLQLTLDQSYHPDGFYTFPSDEFMKNEILMSKKLGLTGNRIHIKTEIPRKLYWADKLGLLIMADVPNYWGEPIPEARQDWENCMRAQVSRDYNHPSIFAWVDFNETWGLFTNYENGWREYNKETQEWVRSMYLLNKSLDPTRLVEDNSACNNDHVQTDINSWHVYLPAYRWEEFNARYDRRTYPGTYFNYIGGNQMTDVPMINSECGNVWGYNGSTGDVDFTWDYHAMMNSFHRHPKIGGWLYTEHHDVINEWNGYVRFDRTPKIDGLDELVPGMSLKDFHTPYYVTQSQDEICVDAFAGTVQNLDLYSSFMTDKDPGKLTLETELVGWNTLGEQSSYGVETTPVEFKPFEYAKIGSFKVSLPRENGLYVYRYILKNESGEVLSRNFTTYVVRNLRKKDGIVTFAPANFTASEWSNNSKSVLGGLKVNGFGSGYFEYSLWMPSLDEAKSATLIFEASAKEKFVKDMESKEGESEDNDFMLGYLVDHCKLPNSYAMTDSYAWKSEVTVTVNGVEVGTVELADDPADHRGILSWHSQPREKLLYEAGSYGYLVKCDIPMDVLKKAQPAVIRFSVPESAATETSGGLAIYGRDFGRYPLDPTIVLE